MEKIESMPVWTTVAILSGIHSVVITEKNIGG